VAGVALSQLTNVGPNLGQQYIVDSFMVVVFGGVGNLVGHPDHGMSLGVIKQIAGAVCRRGAGENLRADFSDSVYSAAAARFVFRNKAGRGELSMPAALPSTSNTGGRLFSALHAIVAVRCFC